MPSFDSWMAAVDRHLMQRVGMTHDDMGDQCFSPPLNSPLAMRGGLHYVAQIHAVGGHSAMAIAIEVGDKNRDLAARAVMLGAIGLELKGLCIHATG